MKEDFIKRQNKRHDKIEALLDEFGSVEAIPDNMKQKVIDEAKKDLPFINGLHISMLNEELKKVRKELVLIEIGWMLLSLALLFHVIVK